MTYMKMCTCECVYRRSVCVWAVKGGDGMPNSLCRLNAATGSSGKSVWRFQPGIIGFEENLNSVGVL